MTSRIITVITVDVDISPLIEELDKLVKNDEVLSKLIKKKKRKYKKENIRMFIIAFRRAYDDGAFDSFFTEF